MSVFGFVGRPQNNYLSFFNFIFLNISEIFLLSDLNCVKYILSVVMY